ncbi:hypothetical protein [Hyalangium rubrum]|uniref:STAS/SEC14 domain-containing protein n=1 Tax=Hyalangium rubrum TaxID=3103134 RepID=A0ABU5HBS3_9BACT|nr:hypothetical protein [Hyalangium sp. s54d21]MDY7230262.1 hypothetical protein [Hyalangium sp. s54d21]
MAEPREWRFGLQYLRLEPPNVLWMKCHSTTTLEEAHRVLEVLREQGSQRPLIGVVDVRGAMLDSEVGNLLAREMKPQWFRAIIYVGAGFLQKALIKTLVVALYFNHRWTREIRYADSEEEARALVAQLRAHPPRSD